MDILAFIEVAIGIVFVWFLTSMLASTAYEAGLSLVRLRAKNLERTIKRMLMDPKVKQSLTFELGSKFYEHPILKSLRPKDDRNPSYIPAWRFADIVFDLVMEAGTSASPLNNAIRSAEDLLESNASQMEARLKAAFDLVLDAAIQNKNWDEQLLAELKKPAQSLAKSYPQLGQAVNSFQSYLDTLSGLPEKDVLAKQLDAFMKQAKIDNELLREVALHKFTELHDIVKQAVENNDHSNENLLWFTQKAQDLLAQYPQLRGAVEALQVMMDSSPTALKDDMLKNLQNGVIHLALENKELGKTLNLYISRAIASAKTTDEGLAAARKNLEAWFDDTMMRLSGHYKRWAMVWSLILGALAAIIFNIDSLTIVQTLWTNPSLRQVVADSAEERYNAVLAATLTPDTTPEMVLAPTPLPDGAPTPSALPEEEYTNEQFEKEMAAHQAAADAAVKSLQGLALPIGWVKKENACEAGDVYFFKETLEKNDGVTATTCVTTPQKTSWGQWALGIAITALATTQGSTFWFEILGKLVNLRASFKPPTSAEAQAARKKEEQQASSQK